MTLFHARKEQRERLERVDAAAREIRNKLLPLEDRLVQLGAGLDQQRVVLTELARRVEQVADQELKSFRGTARESELARKAMEEQFKKLGEKLDELRGEVKLQKGQRAEDAKRILTQIDRIKERIGLEFREVRKLRSPLGAPADSPFLEAAQPVVDGRRTLLGYDRLYMLWQAVKNVVPLGLPAAEVGAFRGGSAHFLAEALKTLAGHECDLHVVDTFEGHPDGQISEHDPEQQRGKFTNTDFDEVSSYLSTFSRVHVYKGDVGDVVRAWPDMQFGLLHLDVDLYTPTAVALEYFGPRLATGGIIVLDDYGAASCPGVFRAVGEFLQRDGRFQTWNAQTEQLVLVKQ
jgi:O-methyltransferase